MKGHGDIRSLFRAGAARVNDRPEPLARPGSPFTCQPGDVKIARMRDGKSRTMEDALVIARRQQPGVEYVKADARWYVFRKAER